MPRKRSEMIRGMVLAVLAFAPSTGWAQPPGSFDGSAKLTPDDMSLEQLLDAPVERVFGASKFEQKVDLQILSETDREH